MHFDLKNLLYLEEKGVSLQNPFYLQFIWLHMTALHLKSKSINIIWYLCNWIYPAFSLSKIVTE